MKGLVEFINESLDNGSVSELFKEIDQNLDRGKHDEIASIIDKIFKAKWGKSVKMDDKFGGKMGKNEYMLLGCNVKSKAWAIAYYNKTANSLYGAKYNGKSATKIGMWWADLPGKVENLNLKYKYADAYADESRSLESGFAHGKYDF